MAVTFQFWGSQVGTLESVDDDGNGNTIFGIGGMPFLPTDIISITITDDSFDSDGEFLFGGDIIFTSVQVTRAGTTYDLSVDAGSKIKESGGGSNKEQGDSFFLTNDSIGPASSGPFSNIPEEQYVFVVNTTLTVGVPVTIPRISGANGNSNFDIENGLGNLICFARGSLIATPSGEVAVERLRVGDLVQTVDRGPQPIRWIASRRLPVVPPRFRPVRIRAGAFGGAPRQDLYLSPQHRVMLESTLAELHLGIDQVLSAALMLENGDSVRQCPAPEGIEYFHFCLDTHEIVLANGLPCETLLPGPAALCALEPGALSELLALFPGLATLRPASAPRMVRPALRAFEARLLGGTLRAGCPA